ncbi:membrane dipeptidase [Lentimicrobium sp. L6]|uniref:dipeptidase n=1 Tax=Lentimicrobium sp. L6 TaxID=2735916 RepID=UPI0015526F9B|nr:dipeptidase [Lentimicrobium sp. L6]NPD86990.1 membrane dipeptidase [Lentimicrobium sp. L6]
MHKIFTLLLAGSALFSFGQSIEQKAAQIHEKVFTIDSHTDTPLKFFNGDFDIGLEHDGRKGEGKVDIPRMEKGGLDAVFFAVFIGQGDRDSLGHAKAYEKAEQIFEATHQEVKKNSKKAKIATTPKQGYQLEKKGKRAIYLCIENGYPLENNLDNINHFYNLGARYITIVHSHNNDISDSSTDKVGPEYDGLSAFGEEVVERMNELGMMVDVSHASDSAFYDVLKLSTKPVIASHSCARALCDNPRNMTDDMLKALAKNGGVIQMCILSDYVKKLEQSPERIEGRKAFRKKHSNWANYTEEERKVGLRDWYQLDVDFPPNLATVSDAVDHIDHIVEVAGIDHVGIGTDFDGGGGLQDCYDASELGNITLELVKRGYSEEDIRKIWGGNFMRVFEAVAAK